MSRPQPPRTTPLLSESQLLKRAGGAASFKPGKGGAQGGETRQKVGSGWNNLNSTLNPQGGGGPVPQKEEDHKVKVAIDDYEEDEEPKINPQRLAASQTKPKQTRKPSSNASRWASPSSCASPIIPPTTKTPTTTTTKTAAPATRAPERTSVDHFSRIVSASYGTFSPFPPSPTDAEPSTWTSLIASSSPAPTSTKSSPQNRKKETSKTNSNGLSPSFPFVEPRPNPISRTSSHSASASRQPKGPPSPSTSQSGTPRSSQTGQNRRTSNSGTGGGTNTSRWATPQAAPVATTTKGKDLPPHAKSTPLPPQATNPPASSSQPSVPSSPSTYIPAPVPNGTRQTDISTKPQQLVSSALSQKF